MHGRQWRVAACQHSGSHSISPLCRLRPVRGQTIQVQNFCCQYLWSQRALRADWTDWNPATQRSISLHRFLQQWNEAALNLLLLFFEEHLFTFYGILQGCHLLPVRWFLPGKQTPLFSSSGLLRKNLINWLATTSTSVWRDPRTGPRPITNLTRTPSMFWPNKSVSFSRSWL